MMTEDIGGIEGQNVARNNGDSKVNGDGSGDFTTYGLTGIAKTSANTVAWGRTKTFAGLYTKELAFMVISTVNIILAVALTITVLVHVAKTDTSAPDFTLTIIILLNSAFCAFYVIHGVFKEREFEIYAFIAAALVILIYCIAEYTGNHHGRDTIKLVRLVAACVLAPPNIYLAWSVARDFGYLAFRVVGASQDLQVMYRQAALFSSLLQFELQISLSFIILVLKDGVTLNTPETVTLGIGIPYCILWSLLGIVMLFKELKVGAGVFLLLGLAKPSYIIYRIVNASYAIHNIPAIHRTIIYVMFTFGAINLVLFIIMMYELYIVVRNFGLGLRNHVYRADKSETAGLLAGHRSRYTAE